ncbi:MAG TPA: Uma2 family endonuclease, partial [Pyrinomonadaceae bacterium]|nr:Uma2 family endonuclease [Pyrinomonadaceae bacterium]
MAIEVLEQATEPRITRRRATIEEFWALPESMLPTEYINGEIVMAPTPTTAHQRVSRKIALALERYVEEQKLGEVFYSPLDVILPTGEVVQPDIFFLTPKEAERATIDKWVYSAPSFAVEILSPGSIKHDTITKRAIYEKNSVREYWIVDPEARSIAQFVL